MNERPSGGAHSRGRGDQASHPYRRPSPPEPLEPLPARPARWPRMAAVAAWSLLVTGVGIALFRAAPEPAAEAASPSSWALPSPPPVKMDEVKAPLTAAAIAPGGHRAATASRGEVRLWDLDTGEQLASFTHPTWSTSVDRLEFSPDGKQLLAETEAGPGKAAFLLDASSWRVEPLLDLCSPRPSAKQAASAAFRPDGRLLSLTSKGVCVEMVRPRHARDVLAHAELAQGSTPSDPAACSLVAASSGESFAVVCPDALEVWDAQLRRRQERFAAAEGERVVRALPVAGTFIPDWLMITDGPRGAARARLVSLGLPQRKPLIEQAQGPLSIATSSSGNYLLVSGDGVCLWDAAARRKLGCPVAPGTPIAAAALSPDGSFALAPQGAAGPPTVFGREALGL